MSFKKSSAPQNAQQEHIIRVKRGGSWGHRFASLGAIGAGVAANYVAYDFLKNKRHKNTRKTPQREEEKDRLDGGKIQCEGKYILPAILFCVLIQKYK